MRGVTHRSKPRPAVASRSCGRKVKSVHILIPVARWWPAANSWNVKQSTFRDGLHKLARKTLELTVGVVVSPRRVQMCLRFGLRRIPVTPSLPSRSCAFAEA